MNKEEFMKEYDKLSDLEFEYQILKAYCEDKKEIKRVEKLYNEQKEKIDKLSNEGNDIEI
jgi:wobble nucleotide-excising tRNase